MARKKKQPDLKSLHEETQKALDKLHEDMQKEAPSEIIASRDMVLSLVKHKDGTVELLVKEHEKYSEIFLNLLLKGAYLALIIDNLPETFKKEYANWLTEAHNTASTAINTKLPNGVLKNTLEGIEKFIGESI